MNEGNGSPVVPSDNAMASLHGDYKDLLCLVTSLVVRVTCSSKLLLCLLQEIKFFVRFPKVASYFFGEVNF